MTARLSEYDRALLWHAIEGAYLAEMRNGADDLPAASVAEHRARVVHSLLMLENLGLVRMYLAPWKPEGEIAKRPLTGRALEAALASPVAWDVNQEDLIAFEATKEGEKVHLPKD